MQISASFALLPRLDNPVANGALFLLLIESYSYFRRRAVRNMLGLSLRLRSKSKTRAAGEPHPRIPPCSFRWGSGDRACLQLSPPARSANHWDRARWFHPFPSRRQSPAQFPSRQRSDHVFPWPCFPAPRLLSSPAKTTTAFAGTLTPGSCSFTTICARATIQLATRHDSAHPPPPAT
jgi:hypothetical protein